MQDGLPLDWDTRAIADRHRAGLQALGLWLVEATCRPVPLKGLFPGFCEQVSRTIVPAWRIHLGLEVLHPEISGTMLVWSDETIEFGERARQGVLQSPSYLNSPTKIVDDTERAYRRRLDSNVTDMPLLQELYELGSTDYFITPLPFLDTSRTRFLSFATRQPGGFDDDDLKALDTAARLFSPYAERQVWKRIALDLLDTYVGARTSQRIVEGQIERGQVDWIEAAIWLADLRAFTRRSEVRPIGEVVDLLNGWFGDMGVAIEAEGGEILKFIGDAVLAIFPVTAETDRGAACAAALAAAEAFCARVDAWNAERGLTGPDAVDFGIGLHLGEIAYGNIGAARRLDFTVIGPAVNRASRLEELTKTLRRRVLVSEPFRDACGRPLVDLGHHVLRDVEGTHRIFGIG
ncbi:adenylate/guanylate cyclase domain-containing protein [Inquilinus limosus]|uniref:adenylate/guanylate cyclase domain-containing protein n=1 Tax=Inquilinus limosus TaxID=171674 RepID=UPI003F1694E4